MHMEGIARETEEVGISGGRKKRPWLSIQSLGWSLTLVLSLGGDLKFPVFGCDLGLTNI